MKPVVWIDAVGLTRRQIDASTPHLESLAARGALAPMQGILPGVTLSAQATMLTGEPPSRHGCVGNGWYWRELGEAWLWRQANAQILAPTLYERAAERDPNFRAAKLFWWFNVGARVHWSLTPKPFYPADGRKLLDVDGQPDAFVARAKEDHGSFPFFDFWGPKAGLPSSRWITDVALDLVERERPTLTMVYLPHLDYDHQRFGPDDPRSKRAVVELDRLIGELVAGADAVGAETVVVSEYGIEAASQPVHINRALREAGLLGVRATPVGEVLDPARSRAFAVADHQIAHVYVLDPAARDEARRVVAGLPGVAEVLEDGALEAAGLAHARSGELVAVAAKGAWFTYYHWLDDANAPDFARTVDIHRKPGYDPCELFVDPALKFPALRVAQRLARKKLGLRYLMDVIPLDASLVGGTHGRLADDLDDGPVFLSSGGWDVLGGEPEGDAVRMTSVAGRVLELLSR
ncbi:MAG: nucleotide pyrophosphatase/phosphodiesterase family protein [Planctomycetota bacterium]